MQAQPTVFVQHFSDLHNEVERQRRQELRIVIESSHYHIWLTYRALRMHNIMLELYDLSFRLLFYLCFLLALFLELFSSHYQPLFSMVAFFLYYIYQIFLHLSHYRAHRRSPSATPLLTSYTAKLLIKNIFESLFNLVGFLLLFLYSFNLNSQQPQEASSIGDGVGGFSLTPWMLIIPFTVATIMTVVFTRCPRAGCAHALHLFKASGTVFKFTLFVTLAFSLKQLQNYEWAALLWPYFVSLPLFIVLTFITLVLLLNALVKLCIKRIKCARVLGSLYIFILVSGFLGSSLNAVIFLLKYAATKGSTEYQTYLMCIFIPLFVYLSVIIAFTFLQMKNIAVWFERMLYFDDIYIRSNQEEGNQDIQIKSVHFETPHFIRRLTHHYFKKSVIEFTQFYKRANLKAQSVDLSKKSRYQLKSARKGDQTQEEAWEGDDSTEGELARVKKKVRTPRWFSAEVRSINRFTAFNGKGRYEGPQITTEDGDDQDCKICMSKEADAVLLDCGHGGLCYECAVRLLKGSRACPLCRQLFVKVIQLESNPKQSYEKVIAITFIQQERESEEEEKAPDNPQIRIEDNSVIGTQEEEEESITRFESPAPRLYDYQSRQSQETKRYESQRPFAVLIQPQRTETQEMQEQGKEEDEQSTVQAKEATHQQNISSKVKILSVLQHQFGSLGSMALGSADLDSTPPQEMLFNRRTKHLVHSRQEMLESPSPQTHKSIVAELKALFKKE